MPQDFEPYEDDDNDAESPGGNDSPTMKQLRKLLKQKDQLIAQKDEELTTLRTQGRERSIADVLKAKGIDNPKVAKLIPADLEPTPDAIQGWVSEYGEFFGIKTEGDAGQQSPDQGGTQDFDAAAQQSRINAIEAHGSAGGEAALQQAISATNDEAAFKALLNSHGANL